MRGLHSGLQNPGAITALMTELTEPQRKIRQSSPDKAEFNSRG